MALLQSHFDYCCTTWFPTLSCRLRNKLQTTQNKIVRFILNLHHREHIGQIQLDSIKLLNVRDRVEQLRLNHVFKIRHHMGPIYLRDCFTPVSEIHSIQTRSSHSNFHVPHVKGTESECFYFVGIKSWNNLPIGIQDIDNHQRFKRETKLFLAQRTLGREEQDFI